MARYSIIVYIAVEFLMKLPAIRLFDETIIQKKYSNNTSALLLLAVYISPFVKEI